MGTGETSAPLWRAIFLACVVAAGTLGYLGIAAYVARNPGLPLNDEWYDILYYDLQLFVVDSAPLQQPGPYGVPLDLARFLAPAATGLAIVETVRLLARDQLRRWLAAHSAGHAIVCGDGAAALHLARELRREGRVVLVGTDVAAMARARRDGVLDVLGDPREGGTLSAAGVRRAAALYACSPDSTTNVAVVLRARHEGRGRLATYAQVRDSELYTTLRTRQIGAGAESETGFRLEFFALEDVAARDLLDNHLVLADDGRPAPVAIFGFGLLGQAVLRELARRTPPGGPAVPVTVVDPQGPAAVREFLRRHGGVRRTSEVTAVAEPADRSDVAQVFVCLGDDEQVLKVALAESRERPPTTAVVACVEERLPFADLLSPPAGSGADGRLRVFGVLDAACNPRLVRNDELETLARAIHAEYVDACLDRGQRLGETPSLRPWSELADDLRAANYAQAGHIEPKLRAVGCALTRSGDGNGDFAFEPAEIDLLARAEHERWTAERRSQGYVYGPVRGERTHPNLVGWDQLTEAERDLDRNAVRVLPTVLDRAGMRIVRIETGQARG